MTNTIFIEHKKVPKAQAQAIKQDLEQYAISVALKFPTKSISDVDKIKIAKMSTRKLFQRVNLSTKNFSSLINEEVTSNLQKLYFSLKEKVASSHKEFLEMIRIVRLLKNQRPRKYKKLRIALEKQLNDRQQNIFNLYVQFKPGKKRKTLSYRTIEKVAKIPAGSINVNVKHVARSLNKIFKRQKISNGRTK